MLADFHGEFEMKYSAVCVLHLFAHFNAIFTEFLNNITRFSKM